MSRRRRRLEIAVDPLPEAYLSEKAACPVCSRDATAIGRRALQIVFRCDHCKVVFKRVHSGPLDF